DRDRPAAQQRDPVPRTLALPDGAVAGLLDLGHGERVVHRLEFLQCDDVGLLALQPGQQMRQAGADTVDVEGGELQRFRARHRLSYLGLCWWMSTRGSEEIQLRDSLA